MYRAFSIVVDTDLLTAAIFFSSGKTTTVDTSRDLDEEYLLVSTEPAFARNVVMHFSQLVVGVVSQLVVSREMRPVR